jgi:DnaJ-class molecular chaperone
MNFYELLGVEKHSSIDEIKKKFQAEMLKYHPDKTPNLPELLTLRTGSLTGHVF